MQSTGLFSELKVSVLTLPDISTPSCIFQPMGSPTIKCHVHWEKGVQNIFQIFKEKRTTCTTTRNGVICEIAALFF